MTHQSDVDNAARVLVTERAKAHVNSIREAARKLEPHPSTRVCPEHAPMVDLLRANAEGTAVSLEMQIPIFQKYVDNEKKNGGNLRPENGFSFKGLNVFGKDAVAIVMRGIITLGVVYLFLDKLMSKGVAQ